jgi:hypothetical protein
MRLCKPAFSLNVAIPAVFSGSLLFMRPMHFREKLTVKPPEIKDFPYLTIELGGIMRLFCLDRYLLIKSHYQPSISQTVAKNATIGRCGLRLNDLKIALNYPPNLKWFLLRKIPSELRHSERSEESPQFPRFFASLRMTLQVSATETKQECPCATRFA